MINVIKIRTLIKMIMIIKMIAMIMIIVILVMIKVINVIAMIKMIWKTSLNSVNEMIWKFRVLKIFCRLIVDWVYAYTLYADVVNLCSTDLLDLCRTDLILCFTCLIIKFFLFCSIVLKMRITTVSYVNIMYIVGLIIIKFGLNGFLEVCCLYDMIYFKMIEDFKFKCC